MYELYLRRKSVYWECLMRPVLIMMVWKPWRSIAQSLMSVRAADRQTGDKHLILSTMTTVWMIWIVFLNQRRCWTCFQHLIRLWMYRLTVGCSSSVFMFLQEEFSLSFEFTNFHFISMYLSWGWRVWTVHSSHIHYVLFCFLLSNLWEIKAMIVCQNLKGHIVQDLHKH